MTIDEFHEVSKRFLITLMRVVFEVRTHTCTSTMTVWPISDGSSEDVIRGGSFTKPKGGR